MDFKKLRPTTKTFVVKSNIAFSLNTIVENFAIRPYMEHFPIPPDGCIVTIKFNNQIFGFIKKKKSNVSKPSFKNSLALTMACEGKFISIKICSNGTIHMTGLKTETSVTKCITKVWELYKPFTDASSLDATIIQVMNNISYELPGPIDKSFLRHAINTETADFISLNLPNYPALIVKKMVYQSKDIVIKKLCINSEEVTYKQISCDEYISTLKEEEKIKFFRADKYVTFLIFDSGKTIMSGPNPTCMERIYNEFKELLEKFEEKKNVVE